MSAVLDRSTTVQPAVQPAGRRRRATGVVLAAAMAVLVVIASVVVWSALRDTSEPRSLAVGGLEVEVTAFSRRADSMMGVNTSKKDTSGPGMSMPGMGSIPGALPHGQERVDVRVEVHNRGQAEARLEADAFQLWSGGEQVPLLQPTVSELTDATLSPGSRMVGTLTFVVRQGTSPLALRHAAEPGSVVLDESSPSAPHDPEEQSH